MSAKESDMSRIYRHYWAGWCEYVVAAKRDDNFDEDFIDEEWRFVDDGDDDEDEDDLDDDEERIRTNVDWYIDETEADENDADDDLNWEYGDEDEEDDEDDDPAYLDDDEDDYDADDSDD